MELFFEIGDSEIGGGKEKVSVAQNEVGWMHPETVFVEVDTGFQLFGTLHADHGLSCDM